MSSRMGTSKVSLMAADAVREMDRPTRVARVMGVLMRPRVARE